jgi:branched-chain amino acid transport system substrate-binding protein
LRAEGYIKVEIINSLKGGLPLKRVVSLSSKVMSRALSVSLVVLLVFLTACGSGNKGSGGGENADHSKPIRIGGILTLSGPLASLGEPIKKGIELYFESNNNMIGNRKVELIFEDDEMNPQVAIRKYHKLVDEDKVDLLMGMASSTILYALRDQVDSGKVPLVVSLAAGNEIGWEKKSDYIYRPIPSNHQMGAAAAPFALKNLGKTAYIVSYDNPTGYEQAAAFKAVFEAGGGKVLKEEYPKTGTTDFATYMSQIADAKPDFVYSLGSGIDGMRFAMQYKQFGLKDKIPLMTVTPADLATTPEMKEALNGAYLRFDYNEFSTSEANKKFLEARKKKLGDGSIGAEFYGYDSALFAAKAIEKAGTAKSDELIKAMQDLQFEGIRGNIQMDPKTHNPILDIYIMKYVVKDGKLVTELVDTTKEVRMPEKAPEKK